jgi:hypothetical protein
VLAQEWAELAKVGPQGLVEPPPEHLAGVPVCLHKYEPLLREAWLARHAAPDHQQTA